MSLLRANTMSLLTVGLLQAATATTLVQSGPLLDTLPWGSLAPAWPADLVDHAFLLAPAGHAAAEPEVRRIAAEQAVPPFAMFLVDAFGTDPSDLSSRSVPR